MPYIDYFFYQHGDHRDLHSFPTRRSSDLPTQIEEVILRDERLAPHFVIELKRDRKSTRLNSSHLGISYTVFCLKKKNPRLGACRFGILRISSDALWQ